MRRAWISFVFPIGILGQVHVMQMATTIILASMITMLLVNCAGPQRLYQGSPREATDVALLEIPDRDHRGVSLPTVINGTKVVGSQVELLPGQHKVTVGFMINYGGSLTHDRPINEDETIVYRSFVNISGTNRASCTLSFNAQAGRTYRLETAKRENTQHKSLGVIEVFAAKIVDTQSNTEAASECLSEPVPYKSH